MPTSLRETLTKVFRPAEAGRLAAHALVERYEMIKPELAALGATLKNAGARDMSDGKMVTTYWLSFSTDHAQAVRKLLGEANIKDLTKPEDIRNKIWSAGLLATMNTKRSNEVLQDWLKTENYTLFNGKYMSLEDSKKLNAPPQKTT